MAKTLTYDAKNIQVLEGLEAVRKRPAMYIGSTGPTGLHHLVYEVVDNSIDEAVAGFGKKIEVIIHYDNSITVIDQGRGIPVGRHHILKTKSAVEVVLTKLHAGGKFDNKSYKVSGGLHGVGLSVVNALSEMLKVEVKVDGKVYFQEYERGAPLKDLEVVGNSRRTGTKIVFKPDGDIFSETVYSYDILCGRLRELAFLNKGVQIIIEDERSDKRNEFKYEGGISEFVEYLNKNRDVVHRKPIHFFREREIEIKGHDNEFVQIDIALQWNDGYSETVFSFANNINTHEGGTHLAGFRSALTRTINDYARRHDLLKKANVGLTGDDLREGLAAVVSVKVTNPQFEGQTKTKIG